MANVITRQIFGLAEEVRSILAELRIAKGEELIMSISNANAIEQSSVDSGEELVVALFVSTSTDSALRRLVVTT
jgi:hypothetical protein